MYSSENEELAINSDRIVQINNTRPPALSLLKKDRSKFDFFNYTNCFKAISNAVALILFLLEFNVCAF